MRQKMQAIDYSKLFDEIKTIAVVGYTDNPQRAGHFVPAYLAQHGYAIIAVNPRFGGEIDGFPCYRTLSDIPAGTQIDVVNVFRTPSAVPALVPEAAAMNPMPLYFWMQPGAVSQEAAEAARKAGMVPILGDCMLAEHRSMGLR
jgi:predicted CoA-binding protein